MTTPSAAISRVRLDRGTIWEIGLLGAILATLFVVQIGLFGLTPSGAVASHAPSLSQAQAISIARSHVSADDSFVSALAGPFPLLYPSERKGPDLLITSYQQVWAVRFRSSSGTRTVILDLVTGDWITTISFAPGE